MSGEAGIPTAAETVVVGAGIIGLTTALHLARAGREVLVIDKAEPWREGSAVNAGTCALQNKATDLLPAYRQGLAEWRRLAGELDEDIGFVNKGGIRVAQSAADIAALKADAADQAAQGVQLDWLDGNALRDRAPWLAPTVTAATFCAEDSFASPPDDRPGADPSASRGRRRDRRRRPHRAAPAGERIPALDHRRGDRMP